MVLRLRPGARPIRSLAAGLVVLALFAERAAALPASAFALPLPPGNPSVRLADETAAPTQQSESQHNPNVLPNVARSLVIPAWGPMHAGYRNVGLAFLVTDIALLTTAVVSAGQGNLRTHSFEQTAQLYAGIDLTTHGDNYRTWLSNYQSSDEYNRLVVYRQAAALYYGNFAAYTAYIDAHSLKGADTWNWQSDTQWSNYREMRKAAERADQRARFAAAGMILNRFAAAIVSSRLTPRAAKVALHEPRSGEGLALGPVEWTLDVVPAHPLDVRHRLAWVIPLE